MAGDLGDLGILTVPLEGDLGPLLASFDQAQAAAAKAGEDAATAFAEAQARIQEEAQEAFAGLGQVQLSVEPMVRQEAVAREAAEAFKVMGDVQVAAAQQGAAEWNSLAATIERAKESAASAPRGGFSAGPTGFFAELSNFLGGQNRRAVADLRAIGDTAGGVGRGFGVSGTAVKKFAGILGELSGVGERNATMAASLAMKIGLVGGAIATTLAVTYGLVKGFERLATLGDRLSKFSEEQASRFRDAAAMNQAILQDAATGSNRSAIVPLTQQVRDLEAALDAAKDKLNFQSTSIAGRGWENMKAFFGSGQEDALKAEEAAATDLAIALSKLGTERERQRIEREKADREKKKTEADEVEKKALQEEQAELQKANALWEEYAERIAGLKDEQAQVWGGEDPALNALRRQADEFEKHGQTLQGSVRQGAQLAGQAYLDLAGKIRTVIHEMENLEQQKTTKGSDDELARLDAESVSRSEDAARRIQQIRMTAAEAALADLRAQHERELQEIESSTKLQGDAIQKALAARRSAQAAEVNALAQEHGRLFGEAATKMGTFLGGWLTQLEGEMKQAEAAPESLLLSWKEVLIEIVEEAERTGVDITEPLQRVKDEFDRLSPGDWIQNVAPKADPFKGVLQDLQGAGADLQGFGQETGAVASRLQADFASSFGSIKTGATSAGQAFETWADRMIQKLRELANTKSSSASGSGSSGSSPERAARGYHGVVDGVGGVDMNLMTFALTRGEVVDIRTADQARKDQASRAGAPPMKFVDQVGVRLDVEEGAETADGRELVFVIRQAVTRALRSRGGKMRRAIDQPPVGR